MVHFKAFCFLFTLQCRYTLMYTYPYAYFMEDDRKKLVTSKSDFVFLCFSLSNLLFVCLFCPISETFDCAINNALLSSFSMFFLFRYVV